MKSAGVNIKVGKTCGKCLWWTKNYVGETGWCDCNCCNINKSHSCISFTPKRKKPTKQGE